MDVLRPLLPKQGRPELRLLNRKLCVLAFCRVLGVSVAKYYKTLRALTSASPLQQPVSASAHGNGSRRDSPVAESVAAWLHEFSAACPETNDGRVLAAGLTSKRQLFDEYSADCLRSGQRAASRSVFFAVWTQRFPQLRVPRRSDHAVCSVCVDFRADLALAATPEQLKAVKDGQQVHVAHVRAERELNARETRRATHDRDTALIYADYGSARRLPRFNSGTPSVSSRLVRLGSLTQQRVCVQELARMNALTVEEAGTTEMFSGTRLLWLHLARAVAKGSSAVCTYLLMHIALLLGLARAPPAAVAAAAAAGPGATATLPQPPAAPLPRRLVLQLDNCSSQNKNAQLLGLASLLVRGGRFDCVEVHFLVRGHTFTLQDQVFSRSKAAWDHVGAHCTCSFAALCPALLTVHGCVLQTCWRPLQTW
jgi:hypothetical protein